MLANERPHPIGPYPLVWHGGLIFQSHLFLQAAGLPTKPVECSCPWLHPWLAPLRMNLDAKSASFKKRIILFIFGCAGSSLLLGVFSCCDEQGLLSSCSAGASHCGGFSCCRVQALGHMGFSRLQFLASRAQVQCSWYTGFVAPQHMESSLTRDWTLVSCFGRQILNHWATREAPDQPVFMHLAGMCIRGEVTWFIATRAS